MVATETSLFSQSLEAARMNASATTGPSNKEIIMACAQAYNDHQAAVDAITRAAALYSLTPEGASQIAEILAFDWRQEEVEPDLVKPLWAAPQCVDALAQVRSDSSIRAVDAGILEAQQRGARSVSGFGVASTPAIEGFIGLELDLQAANTKVSQEALRIGMWLESPDQLGSPDLLGLWINSTLSGLSIALLIVVDQNLEAFGFSVLLDPGLGTDSVLFSAATRNFGGSS